MGSSFGGFGLPYAMKRPSSASSPSLIFCKKRRKGENPEELNAKTAARVKYLKDMFKIQAEKRKERQRRQEAKRKQDELEKLELEKLERELLNANKNKVQKIFDGKSIGKTSGEDGGNDGKKVSECLEGPLDAYMNITSPHMTVVPIGGVDGSSGDEITVPTSPAMPTAK